MQIEQDKYQQSLVEHYYQLCGKQLNEIVSLQAQIDLLIKKIEEKDKKITELDPEINEDLDVNENTDT